MEGGREGCGVDRRGSEQRLPPRSHFQSSFSAVATARRPAAAVGEAERRARCCRVAATEVCKSPPMSVGGGGGGRAAPGSLPPSLSLPRPSVPRPRPFAAVGASSTAVSRSGGEMRGDAPLASESRHRPLALSGCGRGRGC